ncbi:MAG: MFS transporter [Jatrophihabitans sp.]
MTTVLTKPPTRATTDTPSTDNRRWWILAVLGVAQLMVVLDATVVNIALPTAQIDLGFSDSSRQWVVTAYALAFGSLLLIGGRIADVFGRKWVLVVGLAGFALASALGGAAPNIGLLITARAVQGVFAALLSPALLSILTTTFTEPRDRAKAFGVFGAIAGAGASVGLLLGGFLTEYTSWRWTMFVNLIFAALALVGALMLLTHTRVTNRPKLDIPGTLVVSAGLFSLVYGFSHADTAGWGNTVTVGFLVAAGVLLTVFVAMQFRSATPLLPMRVLLERNRGGAYLAMFVSSAGMFAIFLFLTYYLQGSLRYTAVKTGVAFLPMTGLLVVVSAVVSTVLSPRVSPRILIPSGMVITAGGLVVLTNIGLQNSYTTTVLPALLAIGVGLGLVFASGFALGTFGVRADDSGVASATVNTMQQIGGSVGTALLNTIAASAASTYVASHLTSEPLTLLKANAALESYTTAFWWAAGIFAFGAVLSAIVLRSGIPQLDPDAAPAIGH